MKLDSEEILKCLCFVILGYFIAMMFSRMCSCGNGFRVGGMEECADINASNQCNSEENCKWIPGRPDMCWGSDNENNCDSYLDEASCREHNDLCIWMPARREICRRMVPPPPRIQT